MRCRRLLSTFGDLLVALALLAGADLVLFHYGAYLPWLEPSSHAGRMALLPRQIEQARARTGDRLVVTVSDSTGGACIIEGVLEDEMRRLGATVGVANLAQGSSSSRTWSNILLRSGFDRTNTALAIVAIHPNHIGPDAIDSDLALIKSRLRLTDAVALAASYKGLENRLAVASQTVFRMPLFREDLRNFLRSPRHRLEAISPSGRAAASARRERQREFVRSKDLRSARLDAGGRLVVDELPRRVRMRPDQVALLELQMRNRANGVTAPRFSIDPPQARILDRTIEELNRGGIPVLIALAPQSPFPAAGDPAEAVAGFVAQQRAKGRRLGFFHDRQLLRRIESPDFFRDPLHVNARGAELYTRSLARHAAKFLTAEDIAPEPEP